MLDKVNEMIIGGGMAFTFVKELEGVKVCMCDYSWMYVLRCRLSPLRSASYSSCIVLLSSLLERIGIVLFSPSLICRLEIRFMTKKVPRL